MRLLFNYSFCLLATVLLLARTTGYGSPDRLGWEADRSGGDVSRQRIYRISQYPADIVLLHVGQNHTSELMRFEGAGHPIYDYRKGDASKRRECLAACDAFLNSIEFLFPKKVG